MNRDMRSGRYNLRSVPPAPAPPHWAPRKFEDWLPSLKVLVYLQPLLRNAPRKLPSLVKKRKIWVISQFKVIQGHRFGDFGTNRKLIYDFLLLINTN